MKRIGFLWDSLVDYDSVRANLVELAHRKKAYREAKKILESEDSIHYHTLKVIEALHDWTPTPYRPKTITDKGKKRELLIASFFPDRIIHFCIDKLLQKIFVPTFINDTYQCIKGRGTHKAIARTRHFINTKPEYVLKVDIQKFYPSVDNLILKQKLRTKIKDKRFLNLLDQLIDSTKGLPLGNCTSQIFGNIYLSKLDHNLKIKTNKYIRYADDILIFGTKQECKNYLREITEYFKVHKINLNKSTRIFPTYKTIEFLGFRFYKSHTRPKKKTIYNLLKNISNLNNSQKASIFGWINRSDSKFLLVKLFNWELTNKKHFLFKYLKGLTYGKYRECKCRKYNQ